MPLGLLQRLDRFARNLTPLTLSIALVVLSAMPLRIPDFGPISPNVGLIAAYYWGIYRPDLFPAPAAFAVGLWQDVLVGTPLGMNALVLLAIHWFILGQRRFFQGKSFAVVWWAFAMVATAAAVLGISCIRPRAPAGDVTPGRSALSAVMIAKGRLSGSPAAWVRAATRLPLGRG